MSNLAIIPARGGSKRIPRKNIKDFLGKPIIAYSIETALKSGLFDEVMVSTEDEEISAIAIKYGAKVPFLRSKKNSNDYATTQDVIEEVIFEYKKLDIHYNLVCCFYPTAPLVSVNNLQRCYNLILKNGYDTTFPVVSYEYPVQRALYLNENNLIRLVWPEYEKSRSQDLEKRFHDAGQFYWINVNKFIKSGKIFSENSSSIVLDNLFVQDIDSLSDWILAELKYKIINSQKHKVFPEI